MRPDKPPGTLRYKAFISYSHAADGKLAPALETGLERFAKPWYRLRALRVFRDTTGLAVTPELWGSIQRAMESSEYFILLASPAAAQSRWAQQEMEFWLEHRSPEKLLVVLTDGNIVWDTTRNDFDWNQTDALPRLLERRFSAEPNYLDLRWARVDTDLSVRRPRFLDAVAGLAATLRNVPLDDLIGEDINHYRTNRRLMRGAFAALLVLMLAAMYTAYLANQARNLAERLEAERLGRTVAEQQAKEDEARKAEALRLAGVQREREAETSRRLAAVAAGLLPKDKDLSILLAVEAVKISATPEAEDALRRSLVKPGPPVIFRGPRRVVETVAFSPGGDRLLAVFDDGSVGIWKTASPINPIVLKSEAIIYSGADGAAAMFSPDGSTVLTVPYRGPYGMGGRDTSNHAARIWDASTGQLRHELKHRYIDSGVFSPDGKRIVTGSAALPDAVVMWDALTGARLFDLREHEQGVVSVDFSKDGKLFLSASNDDTLRIQDAADGKLTAILRLPGKSMLRFAMFSPDSRILTVNESDPPLLWDWQRVAGSPAAELRVPPGRIYTADFSQDSKLLVTTANERSARVWQVDTGRNLYELSHEDDVTDATFSPDGRWILTTSLDATAVLWEASSGKRLADFGKHTDVRTTARFSLDGSHIATGTTEGEVLVQSCEVCGSLAQLLALAPSRVSRTLTAQEKAKYLQLPERH